MYVPSDAHIHMRARTHAQRRPRTGRHPQMHARCRTHTGARAQVPVYCACACHLGRGGPGRQPQTRPRTAHCHGGTEAQAGHNLKPLNAATTADLT